MHLHTLEIYEWGDAVIVIPIYRILYRAHSSTQVVGRVTHTRPIARPVECVTSSVHLMITTAVHQEKKKENKKKPTFACQTIYIKLPPPPASLG